MRVRNTEITSRMAAMLAKSGRGDLIATGFTLDDAAFERSSRLCPRDRDHAIIHALLDETAAHNAPTFKARRRAALRKVTALHLLLAVLILLVAAQRAHCQGVPRLVLQGIAAGTPVPDSLATAGPWNLDCGAGTTWNDTTRTLSCPGSGALTDAAEVVALFTGCFGVEYLGADGNCHAAGGGGSPAGADTQIQFNNAGAFGAVSYFTLDEATQVLTYNPQLTGTVPTNYYALVAGTEVTSSVTNTNDYSVYGATFTVVDATLSGHPPGGVFGLELTVDTTDDVSTVSQAAGILAFANTWDTEDTYGAVFNANAQDNVLQNLVGGSFTSSCGDQCGQETAGLFAACNDGASFTGVPNGLPAPYCSNIWLTNTFGTGFGLYQSGSGDISAFEGTVAIDTGLTFQGHVCTLVANVMTCV